MTRPKLLSLPIKIQAVLASLNVASETYTVSMVYHNNGLIVICRRSNDELIDIWASKGKWKSRSTDAGSESISDLISYLRNESIKKYSTLHIKKDGSNIEFKVEISKEKATLLSNEGLNLELDIYNMEKLYNILGKELSQNTGDTDV